MRREHVSESVHVLLRPSSILASWEQLLSQHLVVLDEVLKRDASHTQRDQAVCLWVEHVEWKFNIYAKLK